MFQKASIVLAATLLAGCAQTKFHMQVRDDSDGLTATYDQAQHYFVGGIFQKQNVDAAYICDGEDNVARVETQTTFVNGLVASITGGIYTPQQARVYCNE